MKSAQKKDIGYAVVKAALGSTPLVGAAASELFSLLVMPPLEKRREKWMLELGIRLKALEGNLKINLDELQNNETFIDIVIQTTQLAIKTSDKEKLLLFQNVIENAAVTESLDVLETHIFLNIIDIFTIWHIKILVLFDNPSKWFNKNNKNFPNIMGGGLFSVIKAAYPELTTKKELCNLIWLDLNKAGLQNTPSMGGTMTRSGLVASRTTQLGKNFIEFIRSK